MTLVHIASDGSIVNLFQSVMEPLNLASYVTAWTMEVSAKDQFADGDIAFVVIDDILGTATTITQSLNPTSYITDYFEGNLIVGPGS